MKIYSNSAVPSIELVNSFESREIVCAFHDIDGTHSLIRDWVPVMTLTTGYTARYGLPPDDLEKAVPLVMSKEQEEFASAHDFSIESAGLSALTQMEWAIRCGIQNGVISHCGVDRQINQQIIDGIWSGRETFPEIHEDPALVSWIQEKSSNLFRIYEKILLLMSRDRNLADARIHPEKWRVPGSLAFLQFLHEHGIRNYFVTGAVVDILPSGGYAGTMFEEVDALGYKFGQGELLDGLEGSSWNQKLPKVDIMRNLAQKLDIPPRNILFVGDGRSEIDAGQSMGGITISRLPANAHRAREIHQKLKTNFILQEYNLEDIRKIFR
ncbi:MAG: HAD family hydrolase [Lentisphaeria bacterium]|nr:HAD family hydrolase [Lentisphaeria bacterium]